MSKPSISTGKEASATLAELQFWVRKQPAATLSYSVAPATPAQKHVATLVQSLSSIAWLTNVRGADIPSNPLFQAYFFLSLDCAILFVDTSKVPGDVLEYLERLGVERQEYKDL